jgi:hypothetical protein
MRDVKEKDTEEREILSGIEGFFCWHLLGDNLSGVFFFLFPILSCPLPLPFVYRRAWKHEGC